MLSSIATPYMPVGTAVRFRQCFEVSDVDIIGSCRVVVLAVFDRCLYLLSWDVYLCWLQSVYFPSNFPVCGVGLVRNSADELFVEGTYNVPGVDVCVVHESHGAVVLLWRSFVG